MIPRLRRVAKYKFLNLITASGILVTVAVVYASPPRGDWTGLPVLLLLALVTERFALVSNGVRFTLGSALDVWAYLAYGLEAAVLCAVVRSLSGAVMDFRDLRKIPSIAAHAFNLTQSLVALVVFVKVMEGFGVTALAESLVAILPVLLVAGIVRLVVELSLISLAVSSTSKQHFKEVFLHFGPIECSAILANGFIGTVMAAIHWRLNLPDAVLIWSFALGLHYLLSRVVKELQDSQEDPVSGLPTNRAFSSRLDRILPGSFDPEDTLLMIDIDNLKQINDNYGHPVGDLVIGRVGEVIKSNTRLVDLQGRIGGDEFCIYLRGVGGEDGHRVAERIRDNISRLNIVAGGKSVPVSVSIGVVELSRFKRITSRELLALVDHALYEAKRAGKNTVFNAGA